jgi:predicted glycoside hydrolase/deacetylase ChbG (UPF0249 family)
VKKLIVNADDFGFTRDVNQGIIEAHRDGILTATTLMATGAAFDDAVRLAKENPLLDVGCHLVLVGAPGFPTTVVQLVRAVMLRRIRIYEELAAQVHRVTESGIQPSHLDTHKHTHVLPSVLEAVARISEDFKIPWVRRPFPRFLRGRFERALARHGCHSTDFFAGYGVTGRFDAAVLVSLIRSLKEGSTEFMCHPGCCGEELRSARTRLKESRERELQALKAPEVRLALREAGVELVNYKNLGAA